MIWKLKHGNLDWEKGPLVMGILNVTPDSFSDGGRFYSLEKALDRARKMIDQGVDIIDVGGESSRPGADPVSVEEELERVVPVIEGIRAFSDIPVSIDTYKAQVADRALQSGADIINDISGTDFDQNMSGVVEKWACPIVVMHMQGTPKTMQRAPQYADVVKEVRNYLEEKIKYLNNLNEGRIILDPGIGFGKKLEHNLALLRHLDDLKDLGCPLLVGVSNKSFMGDWLGIPVEERNPISRYVEVMAMQKGARVIRTHDVRQTVFARTIQQTLGVVPCDKNH
ncbi:MAG: dihydropteroate synthase [Calditrichaeota bacterium]|nr:MAG: dihydropteroate synthase [Calditrichota bacterium]